MREDDFQRAMLKLYTRSREEVGYNATYFLRMIDEMGGLDAARQLINSPNESQGFTTLWEAGRLDLSVEALAIRPEWRDLFTPAELERAVDRLQRYDYEVSSQVEKPTPLTIQWIIDELNRRVAGRPIGTLQQLRSRFKRLDRRPTAALFKSEPVEKDFAFHAGGRDELQFNVGFESRGGQRLIRHGVAFSLQPSQTVPEPIEVMLPKIGRYGPGSPGSAAVPRLAGSMRGAEGVPAGISSRPAICVKHRGSRCRIVRTTSTEPRSRSCRVSSSWLAACRRPTCGGPLIAPGSSGRTSISTLRSWLAVARAPMRSWRAISRPWR